jgi:iron-sulfur cluster insertion protein
MTERIRQNFAFSITPCGDETIGGPEIDTDDGRNFTALRFKRDLLAAARTAPTLSKFNRSGKMADGGSVTDRRVLLVSENAARRIAKVAAEDAPGTFLRVAVSGGGCSGFQYHFTLETGRHPDDHVFSRNGADIVIDDTSLDLLAGAELDFVEDLSGASFQMRNPNAASSCGCGMSFSLA